MKLILINLYDPLPIEKNVPARYSSLTNQLLRRGHQVIWITSSFRHHNRTYKWPGSRTIVVNENLTIKAFWAPAYGSSISLKRLYNDWYLAKQISRYLSEFVQSNPPTVILFSVAPILLPNAIARLANKFSIHSVVDVQDIHPNFMISLFPGFLKPVVSLLTLWVKNKMRETFRLATAMVSLSQNRLNQAIEIRGYQPEYSNYFYLPYKGEPKPPLPRRISSSAIRLVYLGALAKAYDLETVLKALRILKNRHVPFSLDIFGAGHKLPKLKNMVQRYQLPCVTFHGYIPFNEIEDKIRACDVGLVSYTKDWPSCIPNKPIDYMGLGLPVLSSITGQLYDMINEHNAGKNYEAANPHDLAEKITWFYENREKLKDMGENAYLLVKKHFLADNISNAYVDFLEEIAKDSGGEVRTG
jgi:glycosyltransferase involved in cell wall biosynthesis